MLQAGRSPVRVADEVVFFNGPNPPSRTIALELTHPLTEMSNRIRIKLTSSPFARRLSIKCEGLDVSQPYSPPRPVRGTALPYLLRPEDRRVIPAPAVWLQSLEMKNSYRIRSPPLLGEHRLGPIGEDDMENREMVHLAASKSVTSVARPVAW
jgi:hypothetical protein